MPLARADADRRATTTDADGRFVIPGHFAIHWAPLSFTDPYPNLTVFHPSHAMGWFHWDRRLSSRQTTPCCGNAELPMEVRDRDLDQRVDAKDSSWICGYYPKHDPDAEECRRRVFEVYDAPVLEGD